MFELISLSAASQLYLLILDFLRNFRFRWNPNASPRIFHSPWDIQWLLCHLCHHSPYFWWNCCEGKAAWSLDPHVAGNHVEARDENQMSLCVPHLWSLLLYLWFSNLILFTKVYCDKRDWGFFSCWDITDLDLIFLMVIWLPISLKCLCLGKGFIHFCVFLLCFYSGWDFWLSTILFLTLQTGWNSVHMRLEWPSMVLSCLLICLEASFLWAQWWRNITKIPCISWWVSMW